jgi:DNA/RNA-binding protein KIN17
MVVVVSEVHTGVTADESLAVGDVRPDLVVDDSAIEATASVNPVATPSAAPPAATLKQYIPYLDTSRLALDPKYAAKMPKAEAGSTKWMANKMKAKGLQRLRWYCQICEKQCRDENGFKQHTMSEGHVRAMLLVGEDPKKYINDYSNQFKRDFLQLLRTAHGEQKVHMNNFYQEYIRDKEHIHMNATKWTSLTDFAKYLGKEGLCRVEEGDRGLEISYIDDSPEAIKRKEDVKRKERLAKGDEDMESRLLEQQIKRANEAAAEKARRTEQQQPPQSPPRTEEVHAEPVKVSLSLSLKSAPKQEVQSKEQTANAPVQIETFSAAEQAQLSTAEADKPQTQHDDEAEELVKAPAVAVAPKVSLSLAAKAKNTNPLMKKNPFDKKKDVVVAAPPKKMSNAERIMKEELERKRQAEQRGFGGGGKRPRLG